MFIVTITLWLVETLLNHWCTYFFLSCLKVYATSNICTALFISLKIKIATAADIIALPLILVIITVVIVINMFLMMFLISLKMFPEVHGGARKIHAVFFSLIHCHSLASRNV